MKSFADLDALVGAVPFTVVADLRTVDTVRGRAESYPDLLPALMASLTERARAASIEASCALDGIAVERRRAGAIVASQDDRLQGRHEQELAGCRDAHDHLVRAPRRPVDVDLLLDVHRHLLRYTPTPGGRLKRVENVVVERAPGTTRVKRFTPVPVAQTPEFLDELIARYHGALDAGRHHPVLLTGLFVLDLLAIHPFTVGNGRVARALTHVLLQDAGYDVTRWVSLDAAILVSPATYSTALLDSTADWHRGQHDPWPWLRYVVRGLADCSEQLATLTEAARRGSSKQERVRTYALRHAPTPFRISDVRAALPDVSDPTIRLVLTRLRDDGLVEVDGVGRSAAWRTTR
ncbi:Fic family protein [Cellulomonas phragmiteti]|uniref:Fido domain-containing protein n=1 Tax=Cellulomonas phragmiteti TaxID=478780 RepID=A0ABQ4DKR6_9CELL|nr:Fic family protein [Cellulomonas phragmiteti]GIG39516.1 hypothetical protein Cph01nite_12780 [Cellulomonas phragmiteti]